MWFSPLAFGVAAIFAFLCGFLFLYRRARRPQNKTKRKPGLDSAGPFSQVFFTWLNPLLRAGFHHPLRDDQAPPFPQKLHWDSLQGQFDQLWAGELSSSQWTGKAPSLHRALFKVGAKDLKFASALQLIAVLSKFSCVLIIRRLAQVVSLTGDCDKVDFECQFQDEGYSEGFLLAGLLCIFNGLDGVLSTSATFHLQLALYALQTCVTQSVLLKGMVLHPDAQTQYKRGDLVTLALSDFNRVVDMSNQLMIGLFAPLKLIVAVTIMAVLLGPFVLVVMVIVIVFAYFLTHLAEYQGNKFRGKVVAMGARMSFLNEMLQSVRFTKYYSMEEHYQNQILQVRKQEDKALAGYKYGLASNWPSAAACPHIVVGTVLCLHVLIHGKLPTQADTFTVLGAAKFLYVPLGFFGNFLSSMNMVHVTITRLKGLLMQPEMNRVTFSASANLAVKHDGDATPTTLTVGEEFAEFTPQELQEASKGEPPVRILNQSFSWSLGNEAPVTLKDMNLVVPKGDFCAIVGELGSGKSSLLMAIMGAMTEVNSNSVCSGRSDVPSRVYVAQEPMIMNATVKDNILFGLQLGNEQKLEELYHKALAAAALDKDLETLPAGDKTEIGEKGITLSGGQKARVALARAVLASKASGLVLLDDPLSAVDPHVGTHLFEKCIVKELAGTTRLLVTNQLHFLNHPAVSNIVVMEKGRIVERGRFEELRANRTSLFSKMLESVGGAHGDRKDVEDTKMVNDAQTKKAPEVVSLTDDKNGKLTEKEKTKEGAVTWKSFAFYIRNMGGMCVMTGLICAAWMNHLTEMAPDMVLVIWKDDLLDREESSYLPIWLTTAGLAIVLNFSSTWIWVYRSVPAASAIHRKMITRLLHCPTSFFDRTPSGRIMNRLGEDQMMVDFTVPLFVEIFFIMLFTVTDYVTVAVVARPLIAPFLLVLAIFLFISREVHRRTYRQVIRWWMVSKSPVFNIFEEILTGTTTIFAFGREKYFLTRFDKALQSSMEWLMARDATNLWVDQRLMLFAALVSGILAVLVVILPSQVSSSFGLVALIYTVEIRNSLKWAVYFAVQIEGSFASVERCADFCEIEQEPAWRLPADANLKAQNWPGTNFIMEFVSVSIRYQPHLPRALDSMSVAFARREKVGIVGRTGSGKSTLMGTLFRLFDLESGKILFGGVDISQIGLKLLREQITIVPQDPVLFSGPVRKNLDPLAVCSDQDIWHCLKKCFLTELVEGLEGGLSANVEPGGANFSVGERQVLCLARALLRSSSILLLDEATANVDPVNDKKIQQILQTQTQELLALTIAHRLHTVMHSDRILVLDGGKVAQFDSPKALLGTSGIFQDLATKAGISEVPSKSEVSEPDKLDWHPDTAEKDACVANLGEQGRFQKKLEECNADRATLLNPTKYLTKVDLS